MGRRRRRIVKVVRKKLPTMFSCPTCGEESIRVGLPKGASKATVHCGSCGLNAEIQVAAGTQAVDVYCKWVDSLHSTSIPEPVAQLRGSVPPPQLTTSEAVGKTEASSTPSTRQTGQAPDKPKEDAQPHVEGPRPRDEPRDKERGQTSDEDVGSE